MVDLDLVINNCSIELSNDYIVDYSEINVIFIGDVNSDNVEDSFNYKLYVNLELLKNLINNNTHIKDYGKYKIFTSLINNNCVNTMYLENNNSSYLIFYKNWDISRNIYDLFVNRVVENNFSIYLGKDKIINLSRELNFKNSDRFYIGNNLNIYYFEKCLKKVEWVFGDLGQKSVSFLQGFSMYVDIDMELVSKYLNNTESSSRTCVIKDDETNSLLLKCVDMYVENPNERYKCSNRSYLNIVYLEFNKLINNKKVNLVHFFGSKEEYDVFCKSTNRKNILKKDNKKSELIEDYSKYNVDYLKYLKRVPKRSYVYRFLTEWGMTFYVGKGTSDRFKNIKRNETCNKVWENNVCYVEILEDDLDNYQAFERESYYIEKYSKEGCILTNRQFPK